MNAVQDTVPDWSRREFFMTGCASVAAAMAGFVAATLRFVIPNVLYEPSRRFVIGPPTDFPSAAATFLPARRLFIFNGPDGFYCISSVCTHLGCNVKRGGPGFECPCHGSQFDENGRVVHGPAPASLSWFVLSLSPHRELVVDLDRQVGPEFRLKV
jgi:cytochrome b6-f complex iron-sulfur subunit